jgi:hypothetical protein
LFLFTCSYASKTTCSDILYDFIGIYLSVLLWSLFPPSLLSSGTRIQIRKRLSSKQSCMMQSLRSFCFRSFHHYYRLLRLFASHRYFHPRGSSTWIFPLKQQIPKFHARANRQGRCHLHTGCHPNSKQISFGFIPG